MFTVMKCGHAENCTITRPGERPVPGCAICGCSEPAPAPDLTGRMAKCCGDQSVQPSTKAHGGHLAFFEFKGPGSFSAVGVCKCGYYQCAHEKDSTRDNVDPRTVVEKGYCSGFTPRGPSEFDSYYCGHSGWD